MQGHLLFVFLSDNSKMTSKSLIGREKIFEMHTIIVNIALELSSEKYTKHIRTETEATISNAQHNKCTC